MLPVNISRATFNYVFIDLSNVKLKFLFYKNEVAFSKRFLFELGDDPLLLCIKFELTAIGDNG